eukprot:scaffold61976_cov35-Cyclotella_meneghiniana.AAC.2
MAMHHSKRNVSMESNKATTPELRNNGQDELVVLASLTMLAAHKDTGVGRARGPSFVLFCVVKVGGKGVTAGLVERPAIGRQRGSGLEVKVGGKGVIAGLAERPAIGHQRGSGLEVGQVAPGEGGRKRCHCGSDPQLAANEDQVKVGGKGVIAGGRQGKVPQVVCGVWCGEPQVKVGGKGVIAGLGERPAIGRPQGSGRAMCPSPRAWQLARGKAYRYLSRRGWRGPSEPRPRIRCWVEGTKRAPPQDKVLGGGDQASPAPG